MSSLAVKSHLSLAALHALRAQGYVEPNPLVGAVLVKDDQIVARGHHRKFGGLHAETEALADCRAHNRDPRGSTLYVTLEPCNHYGKQPPCTKAIIESGIARVVIARADPNPISAGGADALRRAGVQVEFSDASPLATHISDPFIKRITTGLPWVIAKWAQTSDGRLITRPDEPRWISNELSRRCVHRLRGRVDAVLTGIGTVLADDPLLTVRGVRARRTPMRIVIDPSLATPPESAIVRSVRDAPLLIVATPLASKVRVGPASRLKYAGAQVHYSKDTPENRIHLPTMLGHLHSIGISTVLVEAGPRLLKSFLDERLVDELIVHVAPPAPRTPLSFDGFNPIHTKHLAGDLEFRYLRSSMP